MKKLYSIISILLFFVAMTSCHRNDEPEDKIADKTIFIYMPYTGSSSNLYEFFQDNISGIKHSLETNGFGNNNVLVFISKNAYQAHLIQFHKNTKKGDAIVNDTLQTFASPAITTQAGLTEIFSAVKQYAPAYKYAMIIGAHGQGWLPAEGNAASKVRKNRWFGSGTAAFQTDLSTLASALEESDIHLQFALFDCCYMACMENVYEMRNVTDYYIASTSEVMNDGVPYSYLFHYLMLDEPDYSNVVDQFNSYYSAYAMPYGTLSVSNCKYADQMASLMRQINQSEGFAESSTENIGEVQDLDAGYFTPTVYYDFGSYVDHCCKDESLLSQYHTLLNQLVPYKKSTAKIISDSPRQYIDVTEFSGLTISDPSTNSRVIETKKETPWWIATH